MLDDSAGAIEQMLEKAAEGGNVHILSQETCLICSGHGFLGQRRRKAVRCCRSMRGFLGVSSFLTEWGFLHSGRAGLSVPVREIPIH